MALNNQSGCGWGSEDCEVRRDIASALRAQIAANLSKADLVGTAGALRLTARTFQRVLAALGTTFADELAAIRLSEAQRRLHEESSAIDVIAASLGFSSRQSFSRYFKRATGHTPTQWRARLDRAHRDHDR
jgi:AraC-like DNA-binding protein